MLAAGLVLLACIVAAGCILLLALVGLIVYLGIRWGKL